MTTLSDQTTLVTGANRGLGREFVDQFLARGAAKVYAAARDQRSITMHDPYPNTDAVPYLAQVGHQRRRGSPPDVVTHRRFAATVCGSGARLAAVADRR